MSLIKAKIETGACQAVFELSNDFDENLSLHFSDNDGVRSVIEKTFPVPVFFVN